MSDSKDYEWFGENLPDDWKIVRLGSVFRERREQTTAEELPPLSVTKNGVIEQQESVAVSVIGAPKKIARKGDFVINSRSDRKGSAGIAPRDGSVSLINIVLEPVGIEPEYARYLLTSVGFQEEFYRFGSGIVADLWTTRYSAMKAIKIPLPPVKTQRAIAKRLDHELSEIDGLIADQQHMADLLEERLKVSIENKILKIPGKITPLRYLAEILPGYAFKSSDFTEDKQGVPLLRGINIGVGNLKWCDVTYLPKNLSAGFDTFKLKYDDIILGMDRPVISDGVRVSLVDKKAEGTLLVQRVARLRAKLNHVAAEWLFLTLSSRAFIDYLEPQFTGVSVPHISPQQLANYKIIVPDIDTQKEIIHTIKEEIDEVSKIKKDITTAIQIAQSRKNALIENLTGGKNLGLYLQKIG
ncbi:restriction endonuclease subunit S [Rothia sp. P5766]|uniref:restriction endonuclease subunit S n=1 Tax=Rothia sp. P5766 TaxID=3402656 RepID=UPI003AE367AE